MIISIFIKKDVLYFKIKDNILSFKYSDFELDFEEILEKIEYNKNFHFIIVFDFEIEDKEKYLVVLKSYKIRIKKYIIYLDYLKDFKKDIVAIGDNYSIKIENNTVEKIDLKKEDNFDMDGIEYIYINEESLKNIFDDICEYKPKSTVNYKLFINIIAILIFIISIFLRNLDISSKIDKEISQYNKELEKISEDIKNIEDKTESIITEINNLKIENNFEYERKRYYEIIKKLIFVSDKISYKKIIFSNENLIIEGVCDKLSYLEDIFLDEIDILDIKYLNNKVEFKIMVRWVYET